jgi:hypothetical protein
VLFAERLKAAGSWRNNRHRHICDIPHFFYIMDPQDRGAVGKGKGDCCRRTEYPPVNRQV